MRPCTPDLPERSFVKMLHPFEIEHLVALSRRVGRNPLLTQASSGNTSIKIDGKLWIKRSGAWLGTADPDTFVPIPLRSLRDQVRFEPEFHVEGASVETAMHALLPQRVVAHVHAINTIAWAVRADGCAQIAERLNGLNWSWIPYMPSGLPLAREIGRAIDRRPDTSIFVLENHGLVVCGESCSEAEALLQQVEHRLAIVPRENPAGNARLQVFSLDPISARIIAGGTLFPCQAIFLQPVCEEITNGATILDATSFSVTQRAVLQGLLDVARRIPADAPIRYLTPEEVEELLAGDAHHYRNSAEREAPREIDSLLTAPSLQ